MSAPGPGTDPEREWRRHRGPLVGMALVTTFGVGLILYWMLETVASTEVPAQEAVNEEGANRPDVDAIDASP
jgi:hypothetical protein